MAQSVPDEAVRSSSIAKLSAPRPVGAIGRPRVVAEIVGALEAGICWLAAPGGYGKTTAVAEAVGQNGSACKWYRVDSEDQDIARLFHYLALSLDEARAGMPVFGPEYAENPDDFARLFFRAYFSRLAPGTVLVFDDLHRADAPGFRRTLAILLRERPNTVRTVIISRMLPDGEVAELALAGQMQVFNQELVEFSWQEATSLVAARSRSPATAADISAARGWAVGLLMLANKEIHYKLQEQGGSGGGFRDIAGTYFLQDIAPRDQELLMKLNLLPEINGDLAEAFAGTDAGGLLERLYHRQLLVTRDGPAGAAFQFHDLLREYLSALFDRRLTPEDQARLRLQAATVLHGAGRTDAAIALALQAGAWPAARAFILERADTVLQEGRRATFIDWCGRLPAAEMDGWIHYWLGVAHAFDDAMAEPHFAAAWRVFEGVDRRGQYLTVARAALVKTASWRTHEGLAAWTQRAAVLLAEPFPELAPQELTMVRMGMLRAINFAETSEANAGNGRKLARDIQERLSRVPAQDPVALRLLASEALVDHAVATADKDMFANAVDSVAEDLKSPNLPPSVLGMWLVSFGAASGRYFPYARRGFAYASAEDALRAAIAIAERHALRNIEFSALYHLQLLMKLRNDFSEFNALVSRLGALGDSRFTTQVAVVADCHAAMHTRQGDFTRAYRDCDAFMAAIEKADEPMVERLPHYITKFQVLLADRRPGDAAALLAGILERLDDSLRRRAELSILAARVFEKKWGLEAEDQAISYDECLRRFLSALREANVPPVLINLPELLAELLADALERGIDVELCRNIIRLRHLVAPASRPAQWPWPLGIRLMGGFRIEVDGKEVALGAKPPTRSLDILRALCLARDQACAVETLQDWLWPDLDGDQAKAAYEQALHRLRKLLGPGDYVVQREGRIHLVADSVWVDLQSWEDRLRRALSEQGGSSIDDKEALLAGFAGPPLPHRAAPSWSMAAADRVRDGLIELADRIGRHWRDHGDTARARRAWRRALDFYPDSARIWRALIEERLAGKDPAGAIEDYRGYERALASVGDDRPSPSVRSLVRDLLQT